MNKLLSIIIDGFPLPPAGIHGVIHWARVYENAMRICEINGADKEVAKLFAIFHDSRRYTNSRDPEHGQRGALLAEKLRENYDINEVQFELLQEACKHHTHMASHPNLTIQTCFDADRLDLPRVGIMTDRDRLNTDAAKKESIFSWATQRANASYIPLETLSEWGVRHLLNVHDEKKINPYTQFGLS